MKRLFLLPLIALLVGSCSEANVESSNVTPEIQKKVIRGLLSPLKSRGVELEKVQPVKEVKIPGFTTYEVTLKDNREHREVKKYVFVSNEGNYIALEIFKYQLKDGKVLIKPLNPKNSVKPLKVDISFIEKIDEELSKAKIPHVVGKGEKKVYIVWDVFCPFCYSHFNQVEDIAEKNNVEIHMIPLAVHGENSVKGLVYYVALARKKGTAGALKQLYSLGNGNFMKYVRELEKILKKDNFGLSDKEERELEKLIKNVEKELVKNNVRATPTIIYAPPGSKKGYIHVGFKPIEEVLKEK
jgi:thiol-disulfide isomerase/thioredoxin